jgi:hypothetical protein
MFNNGIENAYTLPRQNRPQRPKTSPFPPITP